MKTTTTTIRTNEHQERLMRLALERLGVPEGEAGMMVESRWPLTAQGAVQEIMGRGIVLGVDDLTRFLHERYERTTFADGEPLTADRIGWDSRILDLALDWAIENHVGIPTSEVAGFAVAITPADMLEGLASANDYVRMVAGKMLLTALAPSLDSTENGDWDLGIGRQIINQISAAVAGDADAYEHVRQFTTNRFRDESRESACN